MALFRGSKAPFRPARSRRCSIANGRYARPYVCGTRFHRAASDPANRNSSAIFHSLGHGPTCVKRSRFHDCADFVARQEARAARASSESSLMESKRPSVSSAMAGCARSWPADSSRRSTYSRLAPPPVSPRTSSDAPSTASARSPRETASRKMVNGAGACTLIHASIEIIQRLHKESLFPQRLHKGSKDCTRAMSRQALLPLCNLCASRPRTATSWYEQITPESIHGKEEITRACGQRMAVPGYLFREPHDG